MENMSFWLLKLIKWLNLEVIHSVHFLHRTVFNQQMHV